MEIEKRLIRTPTDRLSALVLALGLALLASVGNVIFSTRAYASSTTGPCLNVCQYLQSILCRGDDLLSEPSRFHRRSPFSRFKLDMGHQPKQPRPREYDTLDSRKYLRLFPISPRRMCLPVD